MPTRHRRHSVTETPEVKAALDPLRAELGSERVELSELVILGARDKLRQVSDGRSDVARRRRALADRVRAGRVPGDPEAAEEVRSTGWARG